MTADQKSMISKDQESQIMEKIVQELSESSIDPENNEIRLKAIKAQNFRIHGGDP